MANTDKKYINKLKHWFQKIDDFLFPENKLARNIEKLAQNISDRANQMNSNVNKLTTSKDQQLEEHHTDFSTLVDNVFELATKINNVSKKLQPDTSLWGVSLAESKRQENFKKAQTFALARYAGYADTKFNEKSDTQKQEISNIIEEHPLEIIALSLIAEKSNISYIKNANDLQQKLDSIPQIKELAEQLDIDNIIQSTAQAKDKAQAVYYLSNTPNKNDYSEQKIAGRYA